MPMRMTIAGLAAAAVIAAGASAAPAPSPGGGPDTPPAALVEQTTPAPAPAAPDPAPPPAPAADPTPAPAADPTPAAAPTTTPAVTTPAVTTPVAASSVPVLSTAPAGGISAALTCVGPADAAGIDAILSAAGSPLAGEGATFVASGTSTGIDPRALVAIAAHETILATYGPSQAIHNPFGLGPGMSFGTYAEAIDFAARTLRTGYLDEGRLTLGPIGAKWAPVGASNDPTDLNSNWVTGTGGYYAALGGDPTRSIELAIQRTATTCPGGTTTSPTAGAPAGAGPADPAAGPPVVTAWDGAAPAGGGPVIDGFVFPLALPVGTPLRYRDGYSDPGTVPCDGGLARCDVVLDAEPGTPVVATAGGRLEGATAAEAESGIAFWIRTAAGDRFGYAPLAAYADGIGAGAVVAPGQALGASGDLLAVAWEHAGARVNPFPLLATTRPPAAG